MQQRPHRAVLLVADAMDVLGCPRYTVSGGDVGGAVAELIAAHYPDRVASLHLTNIARQHGFTADPATHPTDVAAYLARSAPVRFEPIGDSLTGINFSQLAIGVLGVLFITGEYGTGMIRSTLAAAPKRLPVLWAKAILFTAVTLVSMEIAALVAFFAGQAALGSHGTTITAAGALRATVGTGLYLTVVALLGIALGFIIRVVVVLPSVFRRRDA